MNRIICVIICLLCWGCQEKRSMQTVLQQAEAVLYTYPDSAYALLSAIEGPERYIDEEYATWCLLQTQAAVYSDTHNYTETFDCLHRVLDLSDRTSANNHAATCLMIIKTTIKRGCAICAAPFEVY